VVARDRSIVVSISSTVSKRMLASVESMVVGGATGSLPGVDLEASVWVKRPLLLVMGAAGGGCFLLDMPKTRVSVFTPAFKLFWGSLMPKMWITYRVWNWWPLSHPTRNVRGNRVGEFA
jgi:hypothetical protein